MALKDPERITISVDGIGQTHSLVRGRKNFWQLTNDSLESLARLRREKNLSYVIRLKTVTMAQNLRNVTEVARFARDKEMEVFYQPIEQNYNTAEDSRWFEHAPTWPQDSAEAVRQVAALIQLKKEGYPIANSLAQLEVMIPYFRDPARLRIAVQSHTAHERRQPCSALTMLQFQANGDVTLCAHLPPAGNIKTQGVRQIWENRPAVWRGGCCQEWRRTES